jgi:hypothetical protein
MIQKKLNKILEEQKTIVLRSKDEYAVKHHTCSVTVTEQVGKAAVVKDAEKCRRHRRSHLQKLQCDIVGQQ